MSEVTPEVKKPPMTFTDIHGRPMIDQMAAQHTLVILDDSKIDEIKAKILRAKGDIHEAGVTPEDLRNVVYTQRMKAKPLSPSPTGETKGKKTNPVPAVDMNTLIG